MKSLWFVAIIALVLGVGTTAATLLMRWPAMIAGPEIIEARRIEIAKRARVWDFWTGEMEVLSTELKSERKLLDLRSRDLDALAQRLSTEKKELVKVRSELEALRDEITKSIPVLQASEAANVKGLSKTYASMKPTQAVSILSEMDDPSVVKLLSVMKSDSVATIFQEMARSPAMATRAARISDQLRLLKKEPTEAPQP